MRKISKMLYLTLMLLVISVVSVSASSTTEALENLIKKNLFFEAYGNEQTAPVTKNDAGNETIKTSTGSLHYTADDLVLEGKNGFNVEFKRRFDSTSTEKNIFSQNSHKRTFIERYTGAYYTNFGSALVFKYYIKNDDTNTPYYIMFDSITELREYEYAPGQLKVKDLSNVSPVVTVSPTSSPKKNKITYDRNPDHPFKYFYRILEVTGSDVTLIRDTTVSPYIVTTVSDLTRSNEDGNVFNVVNLGAGWFVNNPSLIEKYFTWYDKEVTVDNKTVEYYYEEYKYDFYDPDTGIIMDYSVKLKWKEDDEDPRVETYDFEIINTYGKTVNTDLYKMINDDLLPYTKEGTYCIERYDGVRFYFDISGRFLKKTDRFNNTITYHYNSNTATSDLIGITDTYGRYISIDRSTENQVKILVDGVQMIKYTTEYINDNSIDPQNKIKEDDKIIFTVTKGNADETGQIIKYNMSVVSNKHFLIRGTGYGGFDLFSSFRIDSVELPTGGMIYYRFNRGKTDRETTSRFYKEISLVTRRYEKRSHNSDEILNDTDYECGYTTVFSKPYTSTIKTDVKTVTENYSKDSLLTSRSASYMDGNSDSSYYTYQSYNKNGNKLVTRVKKYSVKDKKNVQTTIDYTYDDCDRILSEITASNGETREKYTTYNIYGMIEEEKELQSDGVYVGVKNTFSEDGKKIVKSQSFKQTGENYEYFDTTLFEYNDFGEVIKTTKINGEDEIITNISYNYQPEEAGVLLTKETTVNDVENIDGKTSLSTLEKYDNYFNLIYAKSPEGNVTKYTYDLLGRVTSVKTPDGFYSYTAYDSVNNEIILTDKNGGKQKIKYDALGKEYQTYIYDNGYKLVKEIAYDEFSRPVKISLFDDASGSPYSSIFYEYNKDGSVKSEITKENGTVLSKKEYDYTISDNRFITTSNVYKTDSDKSIIKQYSDAFGNVLSEEYVNGDKTYKMNMTYDLMGNLVASEDFRANDEGYENKTVSKNTYDYAGRNIKTEMLKPDGSYMEATNEYDLFGNLVSATDFNGNTTEFKYNNLGLQTEVITPIDVNVTSKTKYFYNGDGLNTKIYTQSNKQGEEEAYIVTQNIYDNTGNLIYVVANDGLLDNITKYEYNKLGNITKLILGLTSMDEEINPEIHQITNYTYNNLNQLTSVTSPEGITTHFTYDYLGQNLSKYNDSVNTSYIYDGLGRVKEINATGNSKDENISYTYDLMGNIKSMTDSSGVTDYTYNSLGQLIREVKGADVKEYTYDANGNRKTFKLNNEINLTYNYDILNRLTSVSDGTDTVTYSYDNNGNLLNQTGAVSVNYQYNKAGQVISKINSTVNGNIDNFSVSYFLNGNISDITENDKTTSYIYDNLGRLTKENVSTEGENLYSYDRFSNRNSKVETDLEGNLISQTDYQYNKNNQLLSEISGNRTTSYGYDINGNLTYKTYTELSDVENGGNTFTMGNIPTNYMEEYTYDALNRLSAFNKNGVSASYVYDGNGLRQSKTVNGITTSHIYDGQNIVKSGNQLFFRGIHLITRTVDGNKEFYSFNVHNDTTKLVSQSGTILKDYSYDAFGNQKATSENDTNPFRYSGEYFDEESGLIYLRARYYDTASGRFISEDPIKDGLNWYVYCGNNPVNFIDPLGLFDYDDRISLSTEYNVDVEVMQDKLTSLGYYSGEIDGYFGQQTLDAVNAYKNDMGLGNTGSDFGVVGAQTWSSLGLIYRTQDDIDAGVEIVTDLYTKEQFYDVTIPFKRLLDNARYEAQQYKNNLIWFYLKVNHGADWDIKRPDPWNTSLGISYPGSSNSWVIISDYYTTPEEMGNFLYGYAGAAANISETTLIIGSVYASGIWKDSATGSQVENEFLDHIVIRKGIKHFNEQ
ncbi:MAG: hypothetical protein E7411_05320 [Ruminococcaceae bacterium]|nr:hypothetical protein [Oscillospiraceae bacterium]